MTLRIAPGIDVPDCLSEQSPCSKQEYDGEHEQAWHEQKFSASKQHSMKCEPLIIQ